MKAWNMVCSFVFVAFTTGGLALDVDHDDESTHNTRLEDAWQKQILAVSQNGRSRSNSHSNSHGYDVCAVKCGWWTCTYYYCPGRICCTPGDPGSTCCPFEFPVCTGTGKCCRASAIPCRDLCCRAESYCCAGEVCCKDTNSCCGETCCVDDAPCCRHEDSSTCCSRVFFACCEGYGCVDPCGSPFDAIGCEVFSLPLPFFNIPLLKELSGKARQERAIGDKLYRILRPDENPLGIVAKDPGATRTVLSHVNCGGRRNYPGSQYISTSVSLNVSRSFKLKGEAKGLTDLRICEFDVNRLRQLDCIFVDLTDMAMRDFLLGNAFRARNFARAYEEVLLQCPDPVPCTVIDPQP